MSPFNITVVGIGAMGGGMARALLESSVSKQVHGYDHATSLVDAFYDDAVRAGKASPTKATKLAQAVTTETHFVLLALQNEPQCQAVCFDDADESSCLFTLLPAGACVILSSTVTAVWAQKAAQKFATKDIYFVDCPISGGPVRARQGELTLMASGSDAALDYSRPVLQALGSQLHVIAGGAGAGSTVKMVHQLLAGVHIVAAAEALSLAAKAGLDVAQMYDIVNGAAGASWMFQDRGSRMIQAETPQPPKSQTQIFVKDLDIVYAEAKRLQAPIPLASAAFQQFISATSLGLAKQDDSQVKKVYEAVTGVPVGGSSLASSRKEGTLVGDLWTMQDGNKEEILEVGHEPRHHVVLSNDFVRAIRVNFPPNDTTLAHRHAEDSLYFFLVEGGVNVVNHVQGSDPACDCMDFGEIRFGTHKSEKPLVHKITNKSDQNMLCVDAEVLKQPPITSVVPLMADKHELVKTRDKCRVYKLVLEPQASCTVTYAFFSLTVILQPGAVERKTGPLSWTETAARGDVAWKEPIVDMTITNVGTSTFVQFIAEWR